MYITHLETDIEKPFGKVERRVQKQNLDVIITISHEHANRTRAYRSNSVDPWVYIVTPQQVDQCTEEEKKIKNATIINILRCEHTPVSGLQYRLEYKSNENYSVADSLGSSLAVYHRAALNEKGRRK